MKKQLFVVKMDLLLLFVYFSKYSFALCDNYFNNKR